jgi:hypothetical protein
MGSADESGNGKKLKGVAVGEGGRVRHWEESAGVPTNQTSSLGDPINLITKNCVHFVIFYY